MNALWPKEEEEGGRWFLTAKSNQTELALRSGIRPAFTPFLLSSHANQQHSNSSDYTSRCQEDITRGRTLKRSHRVGFNLRCARKALETLNSREKSVEVVNQPAKFLSSFSRRQFEIQTLYAQKCLCKLNFL